jgi:hypothetical protein
LSDRSYGLFVVSEAPAPTGASLLYYLILILLFAESCNERYKSAAEIGFALNASDNFLQILNDGE